MNSVFYMSLSVSFVPLQSPSAVWVQVVHPSGGLDFSDPGRLRLLPQCPSPARTRNRGDEDQDLSLKEWDTKREGNCVVFRWPGDKFAVSWLKIAHSCRCNTEARDGHCLKHLLTKTRSFDSYRKPLMENVPGTSKYICYFYILVTE